MRNTEPVDVLRNQTQLSVHEHRQVGTGGRQELRVGKRRGQRNQRGSSRRVSDGEGLRGCHSVRNGKPSLLGEKAEILSFMRIFVKEQSTCHLKNISKSRHFMSIKEHSS